MRRKGTRANGARCRRKRGVFGRAGNELLLCFSASLHFSRRGRVCRESLNVVRHTIVISGWFVARADTSLAIGTGKKFVHRRFLTFSEPSRLIQLALKVTTETRLTQEPAVIYVCNHISVLQKQDYSCGQQIYCMGGVSVTIILVTLGHVLVRRSAEGLEFLGTAEVDLFEQLIQRLGVDAPPRELLVVRSAYELCLLAST
ncbi:hypothetical protein FGB62_182g06 [Gracilaria domingensis]|nr:hypothetical protein FGB62_182g06 [Gracilaria domingensis]